jgi:hypothetical protein
MGCLVSFDFSGVDVSVSVHDVPGDVFEGLCSKFGVKPTSVDDFRFVVFVVGDVQFVFFEVSELRVKTKGGC